MPHIGLIIIGDEILSGRTQDTNSNAIARFLGPFGIEVEAQPRNVAGSVLGATDVQTPGDRDRPGLRRDDTPAQPLRENDRHGGGRKIVGVTVGKRIRPDRQLLRKHAGHGAADDGGVLAVIGLIA